MFYFFKSVIWTRESVYSLFTAASVKWTLALALDWHLLSAFAVAFAVKGIFFFYAFGKYRRNRRIERELEKVRNERYFLKQRENARRKSIRESLPYTRQSHALRQHATVGPVVWR